MSIKVDRYPSRDLTIFTVEDGTNVAEHQEVLAAFYRDGPTRNVLWDYRNLSGARMDAANLRRMVEFVKAQGQQREGGRTALLVDSTFDFGLSRMASAFAELEELAWEMRGFRDLDDALSWLEEGAPPTGPAAAR